MKTIGRQVDGGESYRFHVAVFYLGPHHHLHARGNVAATPRLQGAVNGETHDCAQCEGHKANHQKPGAIHELLLRVEIAAPVRDTMTRNGDACLSTPNSDFQLGEVTN